MEENKNNSGDFSISIEDIEKRTEGVGVELKRRTDDEIRKEILERMTFEEAAKAKITNSGGDR